MMDETEIELQVAHQIAQDLARKGTDFNELGKMLSYLHTGGSWNNFLVLVRRLARSGAVRSQRTRGYYEAIYDACMSHIGRDVEVGQAARILGWSFRLGRYYDRKLSETRPEQRRKPSARSKHRRH